MRFQLQSMELLFYLIFLCVLRCSMSTVLVPQDISAFCGKPLGLADGRVPNTAITAFSVYNDQYETYGAQRARLHLNRWPPGYRAGLSISNQSWIKVELGQEWIITGIATQGYGDASTEEWVTQYVLMYSTGNDFSTTRSIEGSKRTFAGNSDSNTVKFNAIPIPIIASSVTIYPLKWNNNIGMRLELYGCKPGNHIVALVSPMKFPFVTSYLDQNSKDYNNLAADIRKEVVYLLRNSPGFLSAKINRFNPKEIRPAQYLQTEAQVEIECIRSTSKYLEQSLKLEIEREKSFLDPNYVRFRHPIDEKEQCSLPSVRLHLSKKLSEIQRALTIDRVNINADIVIKCNATKKVVLKWEASAIYETSKAFSPFIPFGENKPNITLRPYQFPPALIYVRLVASVNHQEVSSSDYGLIRIDLPNLVAKLSGVERVTKGHGNITLDASKSHDPDDVAARKEELTFMWYCWKQGETFNVSYGERPIEKSFDRPHRDSGCFGFGSGLLSSRYSKLTVNVNDMKSKHRYLFMLVVTKGKRRSSKLHSLQLDPYVQFSVRCQRNCAPGVKVSQRKKVSLSSECFGPKCASILNYRWVMYEENKTRKGGLTWSQVESFHSNVDTTHSHRITIESLTGLGNSSVRDLRLKIRAIIQLRVNNYILEEEDEVIFIKNSPPYHRLSNKGCHLTPKKGKAISTKFVIDCHNWYDEDGPPYFEFQYQRALSVVIIHSGRRSRTSTRLPLGSIDKNYFIPLEVRIKDTLGDFTKVKLQAEVADIEYQDVSETMHKIAGKKENDITEFLKKGKNKHAAEMAIALLSLIDTSGSGLKDGSKGDNAKELRRKLAVSANTAQKLKDEIIDQLAKMKIDSWQTVTQAVTLVILSTGEVNEISLDTQGKALAMLANAKTFMSSRIGNDSSLSDLERSVTTTFMTSIENLLRVLSEGARITTSMRMFSLFHMRKSKEYAQKAVNQLRELGDSLLATKVIDEKPSVFNTTTIAIIISKNSPTMLKNLAGTELQTRNNKVNFPSLGGIFDGRNGSQLTTVQTKIIMFADNPFTWHPSNRFIKSWAIDINLYSGKGKYLKVSGLKNPVGIFIPEDTPEGTFPKENYFIKPTYNASQINNIRYHRFNIPHWHSTVKVKIKPSIGIILQVFVSAMARPLPWKHNYTKIVPDFSKCHNKNTVKGKEYKNCTSDPYEFEISSKTTGFTGVHYMGIRYLETETHGSSKTGESSGKRRVRRSPCGEGRRHKRSCIGVKDPPTLPVPTIIVIPKFNVTVDVNYTMSLAMTSCLYWSEGNQNWTDSGCKPGPLTRKGKVHCLCDHLSAFGGDFFVEPNPIDFDKVLLALINPKLEDFIVMATVVALFVLYVIGLVFARRADKKDEMKTIPNVFLSDRGEFLYEIAVYTGLWKGSGTTANVGMVIYGENSYTEAILLNDPTIQKRFFARGSTNTFLLYLPKNLGPLYKIRIWHDNEGEKPAWFLTEVVITDVKNNLVCHFLSNKWLALEKGDGEIETEVRAAEKKEIQGFRNVFHSRASRSLADGHLWASVFMRPPQATFTRVQRLSCCLSIIFATMVTNAMFYQFGSKPADTFQIGPLKVSWSQIKIGIQSGLIAIPVNAIIVTIFRNARPKDDFSDDYNTNAADDIKNGGDKKGLPHFFVYVGWLLCIACSVASAVVTILYSLSWGAETANEWLTSILVSFIQDVFVTQPIKVVIIASLLSLIFKKPPKPDEARGSPHWKNKLKNKNFFPPTGDDLEEARMVRRRLLKTARVLLETTTYIIFAILLFIVCYGNRKFSRFLMKDELTRRFRHFEKVRNMTGFWNWTDKVLLPGLYNVKWYNGQPFEYDEGFIGNRDHFLVGMPRLRQIRLKQCRYKNGK